MIAAALWAVAAVLAFAAVALSRERSPAVVVLVMCGVLFLVLAVLAVWAPHPLGP